MIKSMRLATLCLALSLAGAASAQIAGSITLGISITEATQIATGWSVKRTLLDKAVYNEKGEKVGKVEDLIIAPDRLVSYVIVGAGGFIGLGQHDVAIPVKQIEDMGGKLVMTGASKDALKAMPAFHYAPAPAARNQFIAQADKDIASAKLRLATLQKQAVAANADAKAKMDQQVTRIQAEMVIAEAKLKELKAAAIGEWKSFERGVADANARLRKTLDAPAS